MALTDIFNQGKDSCNPASEIEVKSLGNVGYRNNLQDPTISESPESRAIIKYITGNPPKT